MIEGCYRGDGVRDFSRDDEGEEQVEEDRMEDDGGGSMYQTPPPPLKKTLITKALPRALVRPVPNTLLRA
jgi:hypothetical protein